MQDKEDKKMKATQVTMKLTLCLVNVNRPKTDGRLECFLNICGPVNLYTIPANRIPSLCSVQKQYRQEPPDQGSGLVWELGDALAGTEPRIFY
jgi:hypothetical protein